jgi:beta-aspartyl-peptidase (threonine type)
MAAKRSRPTLIIHGGAGASGPLREQPARRRGMLEAAERGAEVLREGGCALDAVVAAVVSLEDNPMFNAGYGSTLNADGKVEMDASLMVFPPDTAIDLEPGVDVRAQGLGIGAVAAVSRVRNPIVLARAVMELTPHVLMVGPGAERIASKAGLKLCRPGQLISPRARQRWESRTRSARGGHGTVGAVAVDRRGAMAAATSTGGIAGKLPGRVGDSAIVGAGSYADARAAASATGHGEAIIKTMLCLETVRLLDRMTPARAAPAAIARLGKIDGAEGGVIVADRDGRIGYACNTESMEVALFDPTNGIRGLRLNDSGDAIY